VVVDLETARHDPPGFEPIELLEKLPTEGKGRVRPFMTDPG
jgi:hypothetical protein